MSSSIDHSWKVLAMGRGKETAAKAEEHLHELGYTNIKVIGVDNDKASDDYVIELLKENDWDGVSIGGGLNGFDDEFPKEITTLHWFNRVVNLIHEHAPKAKVIFVSGPQDIEDSIQRVLGSQVKQPETI